jgi:hypothetical protein
VKDNKHFMLDIESTGPHPEDSALQVGLVEVDYDGVRWCPGRELEFALHHPGQPETAFAKKKLRALYTRCNAEPPQTVEAYRAKMLDFFRECGVTGQEVRIMGMNAAMMDVPLLNHHRLLERPGYLQIPGEDREVAVGDHHYRVYEIVGALSFAANLLGIGSSEVKDRAWALAGSDSIPGEVHDAIYDCHRQIRLLNGALQLVRNHFMPRPLS